MAIYIYAIYSHRIPRGWSGWLYKCFLRREIGKCPNSGIPHYTPLGYSSVWGTILGRTAPNCRRERKQNLSMSEPFPRGPMMLLFDPLYNLDVRGQGLWRDYFYHMAILIDQVFLKVAFHLGILVSIFILLGKEAVQRVH